MNKTPLRRFVLCSWLSIGGATSVCMADMHQIDENLNKMEVADELNRTYVKELGVIGGEGHAALEVMWLHGFKCGIHFDLLPNMYPIIS